MAQKYGNILWYEKKVVTLRHNLKIFNLNRLVMERILGIDTGTNSLGWAIVEKDDNGYRLLDKGTNIFTEGVKIEKGIESSKAAERTEHRSVRKHYWRRKVRKIRLLTILMANRLCPPIPQSDMRQWRLKKIYPADENFMDWQRTEDKEGVNPYHFRYICLTQKLDLSNLAQRYVLGRALYHLNQRRGFLSNRKESTKESDGAVKEGILDLTKDMEAAGCAYLGEYFYQLYEKGQKIRSHYTARKEHYLKEFQAICVKQNLDAELVKKLEKAIFAQRPLKSQKGMVGVCTFEKGKARCPSSHPLYEEFRMYQFLNSIKVTPNTLYEHNERFLSDDEKQKVIPLFMRKSKTFEFKTIAEKLFGKKNCGYKDDETDAAYRFNYQKDFSVASCPVTSQLRDIFGEDWLDAICEVYTLSGRKSKFEILNDVWHTLFFFDDEGKLKEFAKNRLQLSESDAEKFSKISLPNDYAALSLKAIRKILPYMKRYGLIYSQAVFLGNLVDVLPRDVWGVKEVREVAIEKVIDVILAYDKRNEVRTMEQCVKDFLREHYGVDDARLKKMYHPSMIDLYPHVQPDGNGVYQLGSPRISSVRNPMAMHSLFRLRKVVNLLLKERKIDENTVIHIEFSRKLNDANRRKAIQDWQRSNEKEREEYKKKIQEFGIVNPTDRDILKYQLWEEQNHKNIYGEGEEIGLADFLGMNPTYDIEHTIPRSVGGDSTRANLTLCNSRYNREVKKTKLPSELPEHEEILQRIAGWKEKYEELDRRIRKMKGSGGSSKDEKDNIIRRRHLLELDRDYWRGKYQRFTMTEVPEGFSRRQGTDISVISRYARLYLKSVFKQVYIVKGIATSDFRQIWGIQEEYTKKERVNHVHHCIDAITIACIGKGEYDKLAQYYHEDEEFKWGKSIDKAQFPKPWPTFVEDVKAIQDELLIAHCTKDNIGKHTRKRGEKGYAQGDTARASLHNETYYGAIQADGEVKYVVRKSLDSLEEKDVKNIVDSAVKQKVVDAISLHGNLKEALEVGIWMNQEKGVPIKKVRIFTPSVTRPIDIRQQRDQSRFDYKRQYHVQNDRNYMMAIYIGHDKKGKKKSEFEIVNNIDTARYYRRSNDSTDGLVPETSVKSGYPLAYCLKIGTMVLLYDESPDEVWDLDRKDLVRRLYKVTGLSSYILQQKYEYGTIEFVHHQEARPSSDITKKNGEYKTGEVFRPGIKMLHTQIRALVQGVDFEINDLGEIKRLI